MKRIVVLILALVLNYSVYGHGAGFPGLIRGISELVGGSSKSEKPKVLLEAVKRNDINKVKELIADESYLVYDEKKGIYLEYEEYRDWEAALFYATEMGSLEIVKELLLRKESNVNITDNNDNTPLMQASKKGYLEIVKELLRKGAQADNAGKYGIYNRYGMTALIYASESCHIEIVQELLKKDVKVDDTDQFGQTALMYAAKNDCIEIVKELLKSGADIDIKNKKGISALDCAEWYESSREADESIKNSEKLHLIIKKLLVNYNKEYTNNKTADYLREYKKK